MKELRKVVFALGLVTLIALLVGCSNKEAAPSSSDDFESSSSFLPTSIPEESTMESSSEEEDEEIDYSGKIIAFTFVSFQPTDSTGSVLEERFNLEEINSTTGSSKVIKEFANYKKRETRMKAINTTFGENTLSNRACFDGDFNRLVYTEEFPDGSLHVGWIDSEGEKTDVTGKISKQDSFSDSAPKHCNPRFIDDNFYFTDATSGDKKVMYIPINDISLNKLQEFAPPEIKMKKDSAYEIYPSISGGYINSKTNTDDFSTRTISEIHPNGNQASGFFVSWLGESNFLDSEMNSRNTENEEPVSLLPENSRSNVGVIASSDRKEVLFCSKQGVDDLEAFIAPTDGGEPRKLVDYKEPRTSDNQPAQRFFIQWDVK
ncbi:hypothetical protein I6N95_08315 [Vagococcus sp. BWB3-3]|uniref:Uncharacterized protein n=1 Tax=Vagococcus allomyrinae TaxID=2794353 RepID=A0A940P9N3_9ENTE|nr:hypothetical protein [Vagococcus allomyrinae]MBP1041004.1 hypothetical protein [Vagococcus allomyrinae]